jgi:hypothetical protein
MGAPDNGGFDADRLQQLRHLAGDTLDAKELGVIDSAKDELRAHAGRARDLIATLGRPAATEQILNEMNAALAELSRIGAANAFDLGYLCHLEPPTWY